MSLRELTGEKHRLAESTPFMRAVFQGDLPLKAWSNFVYDKSLFYPVIEAKARTLGLLEDLQGIERSRELRVDFQELSDTEYAYNYSSAAQAYYDYLLGLTHHDDILAHLYVWHMGDLYGGQMIKKLIPGSHYSLEFANPEELKTNLRNKLSDGMANEANCAFDWAIKILNEYDSVLN